ncbi:MAG: hypothetical protein CSA76_01250 [Spirochaetales bacterium]|nr:MAG: hypothetical protein CSA76_01250 [Spirochaetales bacterium]
MDLSLGLFSSAGIDAGSSLLLKTLVHSVELDKLKSILDLGCGAGTLGLALAARCPQAQVQMTDRDAMAAAFSRHNASLNKLQNIQTECRLLTEEAPQPLWDLTVCNFPAKAGEPVLKAALARLMQLPAPEGRCALVIVHTLADRCRELISEAGGTILLEESSKQHTVYHFRLSESGIRPEDFKEAPFPAPYFRRRGEFRLGHTRYEVDTVWNIAEFDHLSWSTELMGSLLDKKPQKGSMVFWEPGQGHLPAAVCRRRGARTKKILIAGRDRLALLNSRHNLSLQSPGIPVEIQALSAPQQLKDILPAEETDFLLTHITPVTRSQWTAPLRAAAAGIVKRGGIWAVFGKSSDMAALTKTSKGWTALADKRTRGSRAIIYRRNS